MVAKDFEVGDLVWAKMKGYPDWPAKIAQPPSNAPVKKAQHYVFFFGTGNFSWISDDKIKYHSDELMKNLPMKKLSGYQEGVAELLKESKTSKSSSKNSSEKKVEKEAAKAKPSVSSTKNSKKEKSQDTATPKKVAKIPKKRPLVNDENSQEAKKTKKRRTTNDLERNQETSPNAKENYGDLLQSLLPSIGLGLSQDLNKTKARRESKETEPELKESPVLLSSPADSLRSENDEDLCMDEEQEHKKKIGFLGLGMMGEMIVQNLLNAKHPLWIWNRTHSKCDKYAKQGAIKAASPADVVKECDITFCCVSDPHAVRTIIFGDNGVLKGFEECPMGSRGYVEMTSIDADTSMEIAEAIENTGMKYLECPVIGSKNENAEATVLILASGDRQLFNDCETCFHSMCNHAYYLSCRVGRSSNINIITSMFVGIVYAALAEALALTERLKLSQSDLLEILELRGMNCPLVLNKGRAILEKNFQPSVYLKHQQKDLKLALTLSDSCDQPMPIATAANQLYNMARLLGCSEDDAAAVYHGVWH